MRPGGFSFSEKRKKSKNQSEKHRILSHAFCYFREIPVAFFQKVRYNEENESALKNKTGFTAKGYRRTAASFCSQEEI